MRKRFTLLTAALLLLTMVHLPGKAVGQILTTDLDWGTPQISENFNSLNTTSATAKISSDSQTAYGVFNKMYNNNTGNTYAIVNDEETFNSKILSLTSGSGSPLIASITKVNGVAVEFASTGAFSIRIAKTNYTMFGLYAADGNSAYAKADASVYLKFQVGSLTINDGSGWVSVGSYGYGHPDVTEIRVVYNNTEDDDTYGNGISIGAKKAHVFVNGSCVMNGDSPKEFTIPGKSLTVFRVLPNASNGSTCTIDDVNIYDALPTVPSSGYRVTYNANGATSGTVPVDNNEYEEDDVVTVLGNTGNLAKSGYTWAGWCMNAGGTGTVYTAGQTFTITESTTLYAKWNEKTITNLAYSGSPTTTSYYAGQNFDPTGLTVTATFNDNSTENVTSQVVWTPSPLTVGTISVTGTYMGQTITVGGLTVTAAPGTIDNPYTVAQAIANTPSSGNVYIQGIVSSFYNTSIVGDNNNYRYYISDDGTTTTQLLVYKGKGLNEATFTSADDLLVGDEVVIYGSLITYNSAPEVASGNYLYSWNRPASINPSITVTPATVNPSATDVEGTLAIAYANLDITDRDDFDVEFYDAEGTALTSGNEPDWIEVLIAEENNEYLVSYTMDANQGAARTAYFKVFALGTNDYVYSNLVTVTQAKYVPTPTNDPYVRIGSLDYLTDGSIVIIAARYNATTNAYYAMSNTVSGKPTGVAFTSTAEKLPASIVNDEDDYYWIVNVTNDGYTFTNADGDMIGYGTSGTDFQANGNHTAWTIERETSDESAMVGEYTGFVIKNANTDTRGFALNSSHNFGPYATSNTASSSYNFYLDFFVQTADETYTLNIAQHGETTEDGGWHLIASPVASVTPSTDNGFIATTAENYDLYYFDQDSEMEWKNYKQASFNLVSGKGYLYANGNENGTTLTFTGTPYVGDGKVTLTYTAGIDLAFNLIGNPFSTAATIDMPFYRMNKEGSALNAYTETGKVDAMEGVFVYAYDDDETNPQAIETATFTASRSGNAPQDIVNLNVEHNASVVDNAIIRFDGGLTLPKFMLNENNTKLYIPQNGKEYAIVRAKAQGEMPVNFKASTDGEYTITVNPEGVEMNYLHLIDNMTGMDIDLLQTPSYTFDATTRDYESRFRLVFGANNVDGPSTGSGTFAYFNGSEWQVSNEGEATLQVIDMMGRIVSTETVNGNCNLNLNQNAGVYMLRLINSNGVKTQKVVVR